MRGCICRSLELAEPLVELNDFFDNDENEFFTVVNEDKDKKTGKIIELPKTLKKEFHLNKVQPVNSLFYKNYDYLINVKEFYKDSKPSDNFKVDHFVSDWSVCFLVG